LTSTNNLIKADKSNIYRTLEIKRRLSTTGLYEDTWQDISKEVKKWGVIKSEIDAVRLNKFNFSSMKVTFANDTGFFNEESDPASFWFGFLPIQRTLVRIRTGFFKDTISASGIYERQTYPEDVRWDDDDIWDGISATWDGDASTFKGIVSGDLLVNDKNQTTFNMRPTIQVFRDYAAQNLTAYTNSMTSSKFIEMVRDHTDANGNFIFRPFFDDTTTNWLITTTTAIYPDLNTSTAEDVINKNVWDIMAKLAEAENFVVYIDRTGKFVFKNKDDITTTAYEFHGLNSGDTEFGHTIKNISSFGLKVSKFYSRVQIKHAEPDTSTSYEVTEATLTVSPQSAAWLYGQRTLSIENLWMSAALAQSLSTSIFNEVSAIKNEIRFTTSFVPQLDILDRATISYNSGEYFPESQWDLNDWGADTTTAEPLALEWNKAAGDSIDFNDKEFKLLSYELDLDKLESRFVAREV